MEILLVTKKMSECRTPDSFVSFYNNIYNTLAETAPSIKQACSYYKYIIEKENRTLGQTHLADGKSIVAIREFAHSVDMTFNEMVNKLCKADNIAGAEQEAQQRVNNNNEQLACVIISHNTGIDTLPF